MTDTSLMTAFWAVFAGLLGLVMGSFLNCAAIRLVKGERLSKGRSHCCACGHTLAARDLVPVFSWLFLRGRCRYCGEKISVRYPLSELIAAAVFVSAVLKFGVTIRTAEMLLISSFVLCACFTDLEDCLIPNRLILMGLIVRVLYILFSGDIRGLGLQSLIGAFSVSLPVLLLVLLMEKVWKKEAMGGGDIKLLFLLGSCMTWQQNLLGLIFACVFGLIFGLIRKRRGSEGPFPFGPAIALGSWISLLIGSGIISWYAGLFLA